MCKQIFHNALTRNAQFVCTHCNCSCETFSLKNKDSMLKHINIFYPVWSMITLRINLLRIFNWIMTSMLGAGWVFIIYEENNVKLSMLNINKKIFLVIKYYRVIITVRGVVKSITKPFGLCCIGSLLGRHDHLAYNFQKQIHFHL